MKPAEPHGTEVDTPGVFGDLFETDDLSLKDARGFDLTTVGYRDVLDITDDELPGRLRILVEAFAGYVDRNSPDPHNERLHLTVGFASRR